MSPDKDKLLCDKYPKIFANRHAPMTETSMCWGFEHGDGWFNLIDTLCANIQHRIDESEERHDLQLRQRKAYEEARTGNWQPFDDYYSVFPKDSHFVVAERKSALEGELPEVSEPVHQVVTDQVKEKFGGLRFYYSGGDDQISGMVQMAGAMSCCTCEECGCPGTQNSDGWISTRCAECRK